MIPDKHLGCKSHRPQRSIGFGEQPLIGRLHVDPGGFCGNCRVAGQYEQVPGRTRMGSRGLGERAGGSTVLLAGAEGSAQTCTSSSPPVRSRRGSPPRNLPGSSVGHLGSAALQLVEHGGFQSVAEVQATARIIGADQPRIHRIELAWV